MLSKIKRVLNRLNYNSYFLNKLRDDSLNDIKNSKILMGKILVKLNSGKKFNNIQDTEFSVFSQWGDDGIIQYLLQEVEFPNKTFIEFGVENYTESNTRFLLINNNWSGFVIDGSEDHIKYIQNDVISWGFDLHSKAAFITKDNINTLLNEFVEKGYDREIGILSIDIDGNDYWVWKEINSVNPILVITEYNSVFGKYNAWTTPYEENFIRSKAHESKLYYGASLSALCDLAKQKGYCFIGCNSAGNNAYFIRRDKLGGLKELTPSEGYVISKFREFKNKNGERVFGDERLQILKGLPIYNIKNNNIESI